MPLECCLNKGAGYLSIKTPVPLVFLAVKSEVTDGSTAGVGAGGGQLGRNARADGRSLNDG
jgi:hypothetical protein